MKKQYARFFSVCVSITVLMAMFTGCTGAVKNAESTTAAAVLTTQATMEATAEATAEVTTVAAETTAVVKGKDYWEMLNDVNDSSDLPDWTGKQLKLVEWIGHGTGMTEHLKADNDVVTPEIKRVTGVELDAENSFDNGQSTIDVKMSLLSAAGDWPDIINTTDTLVLKELVQAGKLYDLTELLPKYCPEMMSIYNPVKFPKIAKDISADLLLDTYFFAPAGASREFTYQLFKDDADFDKEKYARILPTSPMNDWPRIWVRDDILKKMYPTAKTQDEIEALYVKNGTFTKEEIFDVPINSKEDFFQFLRDMKALIDKEGIKENGKPVEVTYAAEGSDNWPIVACLLPQVNGVPTVDYFTYFDEKAGKIVYSYKQDWFKTMMKDYQGLVHEGIVSQESLIDNSTAFTEKLNSGHYAISVAWLKPDSAALTAAGKPYRYRFLWPNVTYNYEQFSELQGPLSCSHKIGIFKDSVAEEDLPQILRYLNYNVSEIGSKLKYWGPRSAGLFTEENGVRKYVDPELEQNMCYDVDNKANIKYNLYSYNINNESYRSAWPQYPLGFYAGKDHPKYVYPELARGGGSADTYFQPGMLPGMAREERFVFVEHSDFFPDFGDQWNVFNKGRDAFEKALTTVFAAKDNAQFEKLWNDFLTVAEEVGMTDANLEEVNKIFSKKSPNAVPDSAKITK